MLRSPVWLTALSLVAGAVIVMPGTALAWEIDAAAVPTDACPATVITPDVTPRAEYLSDRLRGAGYSPAATAAVLGNLDQLSALTPTAQSQSGTRIGLALWGTARWNRYLAYASSQGTNRWFLSSQASFLLRELEADPGSFRHRRFRHSRHPVNAAVYFYRNFVRGTVPVPTVRATRGAKAAQWAQVLSGRRVDRTPGDNNTYGLSMTCEPPAGTLERCPMVPRSFKVDFNRYTKFRWDRMSESSRLASRCVYANFPRIRIHGTYRPGHMPTWGRALDFMMPSGCHTGKRRSWTTSDADLLLGTRLAQYLLRRGVRLGLDYVIWQDRARNPGTEHREDPFAPIDSWRQDTYNNGDCTNTHFDHVHLSVKRNP